MSVTILGPLAEGGVQLPFYSFKVPAGFPSPAADHLEQHISIDELLDIRAPHIYPTDDVRLMTKAAVEAVDRVFRPGFKYSKAEVLLVNLCQKGEYTEDLFSISQPEATEKVMGVLDAINGKWGRGTMRLASVPTDPDWGMGREMMSQSFTTRFALDCS